MKQVKYLNKIFCQQVYGRSLHKDWSFKATGKVSRHFCLKQDFRIFNVYNNIFIDKSYQEFESKKKNERNLSRKIFYRIKVKNK